MKRLSREARRASILDAAGRILSSQGFAGARCADIAREAGVSPALLFRHFPTLRSLEESVVQEARKRCSIRWPRGLSRLLPREALAALAASLTHAFRRDPVLLRLLLFGALSKKGGCAGALRREIRRLELRLGSLLRYWGLRGWIEVVRDPEAHARWCVASWMHLVLAREVLGTRTGAGMLEKSVQVFLKPLERIRWSEDSDLARAVRRKVR
jgi:AcrR family transcriptional regulator